MAILFVQNPTSAAASAVTATTGSATWTTGNTIVVIASIRTTSSTVSSITQSAGSNTYTKVAGASGNNGTTTRIEVWTATNITGGTFSISVNLSATSKQVASAAEYSGVKALGIANFTTPQVSNPSISLTTQDNNNFSVGGFAGQGTGTFTAGTGNLRGNAVTSGGGAASNVGGAEVDNTVATPSSVTISVTNTDGTWAAGAIELRSVVPAGTLVAPRSFALLGVGA